MQYDVIFDGQIKEGCDMDEVKKKVAALFKLNAEKAEKLFSGKSVVVKRNVDFEEASRYWDAFENAGAKCRMEPVKEAGEEGEDDEEAKARKIWY